MRSMFFIALFCLASIPTLAFAGHTGTTKHKGMKKTCDTDAFGPVGRNDTVGTHKVERIRYYPDGTCEVYLGDAGSAQKMTVKGKTKYIGLIHSVKASHKIQTNVSALKKLSSTKKNLGKAQNNYKRALLRYRALQRKLRLSLLNLRKAQLSLKNAKAAHSNALKKTKGLKGVKIK